MPKRGKKYIQSLEKVKSVAPQTFNEAIEMALSASFVKFDPRQAVLSQLLSAQFTRVQDEMRGHRDYAVRIDDVIQPAR